MPEKLKNFGVSVCTWHIWPRFDVFSTFIDFMNVHACNLCIELWPSDRLTFQSCFLWFDVDVVGLSTNFHIFYCR